MKPIIYLLFAAIIISGCKKDGGSGPQHHTTDVYVSGTSVPDPDNEGATLASYWKNGVLKTVTGPVITSPGKGSVANGIAIKDTDVYLAGAAYNSSTKQTVACYWKNGVFNPLPDDGYGSGAMSIAISGQDIYIAGAVWGSSGGNITGVYWKNGQRHDIGAIYPGAIAVKGSDIYVVGYSYPGKRTAIIWKNGTITDLAPASTDAYATGVSLRGNDVYIAGTVRTGTGHQIATYWKNNVAVQLQPDTANSVAGSILAVNSDVYVSFYINSGPDHLPYAYYWKNGTITKMAENGTISGFAVDKQDVYICGIQNLGYRPSGVYWKNGVAKMLDGAFAGPPNDWNASTTSGIVVVNH